MLISKILLSQQEVGYIHSVRGEYELHRKGNDF